MRDEPQLDPVTGRPAEELPICETCGGTGESAFGGQCPDCWGTGSWDLEQPEDEGS